MSGNEGRELCTELCKLLISTNIKAARQHLHSRLCGVRKERNHRLQSAHQEVNSLGLLRFCYSFCCLQDPES